MTRETHQPQFTRFIRPHGLDECTVHRLGCLDMGMKGGETKLDSFQLLCARDRDMMEGRGGRG